MARRRPSPPPLPPCPPPPKGLCLKGRGAIGAVPERLESGRKGCDSGRTGRLLAVGNAVGAGVGVWECLWGRVSAVGGGGGVPPPPLQAIPCPPPPPPPAPPGSVSTRCPGDVLERMPDDRRRRVPCPPPSPQTATPPPPPVPPPYPMCTPPQRLSVRFSGGNSLRPSVPEFPRHLFISYFAVRSVTRQQRPCPSNTRRWFWQSLVLYRCLATERRWSSSTGIAPGTLSVLCQKCGAGGAATDCPQIVRFTGGGGGGQDAEGGLGSKDRKTSPTRTTTNPSPPTTGLCERGNDTSKSTGRSGRQNAATRRNMRREERVTVQGPVKEQRPDGMSHGGGGQLH